MTKQESVTLPSSLTKGLNPEYQQNLQGNLEHAYSQTVQEGEKILKPLHEINEMVNYVKNPESLTDTEYLDVIAEEHIFNRLHLVLHEKVSSTFGLEILDYVFTNREEIPHTSNHLQMMEGLYSTFSEIFQDTRTKEEIEEKIAVLQQESLTLLEHEASVFGDNIAKTLIKQTPEEQKEIKTKIEKVLSQHFQKKNLEKTKKNLTEKAGLYISEIGDNPEDTVKVIRNLRAMLQLFNETPLTFHSYKNKNPRKADEGVDLRLSLLKKLEDKLPITDTSEESIRILIALYQPILKYFDRFKSFDGESMCTESDKCEQVSKKTFSLEERLKKFENEDEVPF